MIAQKLLPGSSAQNNPAQHTTLGVMGGGQLGRMFVHAAQSMGYFTAVLDPDPVSPAGLVSHYHIKADYLDEQGLAQLMQRCAAVTTEFENVPAGALRTLGGARFTAPDAHAVSIAQDRILEKSHLARSGTPVAPYAVIESAEQLHAVPDHLFPGILKTARLGYDGKGQVRVHSRGDLAQAWQSLKQMPCVLEQMLPLAAECSVIVARGSDGQVVHFAPQRNLHRGGILAVTEAFAGNLPAAVAAQAVATTVQIATDLAYVGVLCVEFFLLQEGTAAQRELGTLVVNEMAPRPHNSGHYTLDACDSSQFDLQVRTLAGMPLTMPRQHSAAVMLNLLGELWVDGRTPPWDALLALPGAHLHLYGKLKPSVGRKMGHLTITAASADEARSVALQAALLLGIAPF